jgi:hypothetical protein
MEIKGIDRLSIEEIRNEVARGAKFVFFTYTISLLVITLRRSSDIYFMRSNESAIKYGWPFFLISFFLGWWGIPWGPIYTIQALFHAFGGKDVSADVLADLEAQHARENPIVNWDQFNQQINN